MPKKDSHATFVYHDKRKNKTDHNQNAKIEVTPATINEWLNKP